MKSFTKVVLIGGLLTSGLAAGTQMATASNDERGGIRRGDHSRMPGPGMDDGNPLLERMTEQLNLTKDQQASVREILKKFEPKMRELMDKMRTSREALRKQTDDGKADDKQVQKLAQEQGQLMAETIVQRTRIDAEIQKVLTDAQRQKFKEIRGDSGRDPRGRMPGQRPAPQEGKP